MNNKKEEAIEQYADTLYKLAFLRLKNREDAEDVVQEVFYKYIKANMQFESTEHEKAWLIQVTLNQCRSLWRAGWNKKVDILPEQEACAALGMEQAYLVKERDRKLLREILKLPGKYREVIHLFYYENYSVKEIAMLTGRKENTVTSQLSRGRALLKKALGEAYDYEEI